MIPPPFAFPEVASGSSPESRTDGETRDLSPSSVNGFKSRRFLSLPFFSAVGGGILGTGSYCENGCGVNVQSCLVPPGPLLSSAVLGRHVP